MTFIIFSFSIICNMLLLLLLLLLYIFILQEKILSNNCSTRRLNNTGVKPPPHCGSASMLLQGCDHSTEIVELSYTSNRTGRIGTSLCEGSLRILGSHHSHCEYSGDTHTRTPICAATPIKHCVLLSFNSRPFGLWDRA